MVVLLEHYHTCAGPGPLLVPDAVLLDHAVD